VTLRPPVAVCTVCYPREYCTTSIASGACLVVVTLSRTDTDTDTDSAKTTTDNGTDDTINNDNNITTTQLRPDISESIYRLVPTALSRRLA
jgi:carbohydrate-binding DOMON domain-containing protein